MFLIGILTENTYIYACQFIVASDNNILCEPFFALIEMPKPYAPQGIPRFAHGIQSAGLGPRVLVLQKSNGL
ncbi:hypothetical protein VK70_10800 [Paenibacillus durus ATCC 35681]|uniref:Uncharacterized protein n=1 Tax=Paenibacillus durus ATCC 35681 TaxID=1333534 RepID=A0A0F7F964_PAEDU|nr:hypothetical protein VK70_10800 [Paenibacillus durus ATCC 35681]